MKIQELHIGMVVAHPQLGTGIVKGIGEYTASILFNEGLRTISPETSNLAPAEPAAALSGLTVPLKQLIDRTCAALLEQLGLENPREEIDQLANRWLGGTLILRPADQGLQAKEIPLEVFFHKIVMIRNNLRVLEQKINSHEKLNDADRIEMQQYISRSYGSLTTFNILFKEKKDQFASGT